MSARAFLSAVKLRPANATRVVLAIVLTGCSGEHAPNAAGAGTLDGGSPEASAGCPDGQTLCGTECVDLGADSNHCGGCGTRCCGGSCNAGSCPDASKPAVLAGGNTVLSSVAVDDRNIYWTNAGASGDDGAVFKMARTGGTPVPLITAQSKPRSVIVAGKNLYWVNAGGGTVMSIPTDGGAARTIVTDSSVSSIASYGTTLYYNGGHALLAVPVDGAEAATPLVGNLSTPPRSLAVDSEYAFYIATLVSYQGYPYDQVFRVPRIGGGSPTNLSSSGLVSDSPSDLAIDATNVYWFDEHDGAVHQSPRTGKGTDTLTIAQGQSAIQAMVADNLQVYWGGAHGIMRAAAATSTASTNTPTAMTSAGVAATGIVVDSACLYWTSAGAVFSMKR